MVVHAFQRLGTSDSSTARTLEMISRARTPLLISIALVVGVAVLVPVLLGLPSLSAGGVLFCAALITCLRAIETSPKTFGRAGHAACLVALANLAYAIFGLHLPPEISVYFSAIALLSAAQFLGLRAAAFWGTASIVLVAAASLFAPQPERDVPAVITLAVRCAALMTVLAFAISFRQSQDQQSAEFEIRAITDPLTGLANRRELDRQLGEALLRSQRFDRQGALIYVDLDGVKRVNDSFGHSIGDELIKTSAVRISRLTRRVDTPARLGGDEFVILLSEFGEPGAGEIFSTRLLAALCEPIEVGGRQLTPSASIGVALFPSAGLDADSVIRAADDAMYQAKRAGGGRVFLCDGTELREVA